MLYFDILVWCTKSKLAWRHIFYNCLQLQKSVLFCTENLKFSMISDSSRYHIIEILTIQENMHIKTRSSFIFISLKIFHGMLLCHKDFQIIENRIRRVSVSRKCYFKFQLRELRKHFYYLVILSFIKPNDIFCKTSFRITSTI